MSPVLTPAIPITLIITVIAICATAVTTDADSQPVALDPAPKIRIVAQHLILFEDDRRRAETVEAGESKGENELSPALADDDNDSRSPENDSRQESTLEVITETPNSVVVLEEKLYQESVVHLECAAPYPVEWVYEGEGYPDPVLSFLDSNRNAPNYTDQSTYTYSTKLDLVTLNGRNTGRYTCKSIELIQKSNGQGSRQAYFYIYVPEKSVFVTDQPALKSKVTPSAPGKEGDGFGVLLPCTVTNPNTILSLYKINKRSSYLHEIRGATYDPSAGFSFKSFTPWGIYVCITRDRKRLMMAFAKPNRTLPAGSEAKRTQFSYDASLRSFLCCVNSSSTREGLKPDMRYIACSSRAECQIRKHAQGQFYKYGEPVPSASAVWGKDRLCQAMRASETWKLASKPASGSKYRTLISTRELSLGGGRRMSSGGMFQCRIGTQIDDYYFVWRNSQTASASANEPEPVLDLAASESSEFIDIMFKISSTPVSGDGAGPGKDNPVPVPVSVPVPRIKRGVPIRVECNYNTFLFTKGLIWLFGHENGTSTVVVKKELIAKKHYYVEPRLGTQDSDETEEAGGLREYTTIVFPDTNITSLICSVPVAAGAMAAGDGEWRNVSKAITVVE